jgi:hypothetical protein
VREVVKANGYPTTQANVKSQWTPSDQDTISDVTWILEPERSSRVTKWIGSYGDPLEPAKSKQCSTITAFQHYSFQVSYEWLVFVDLQNMSYYSDHLIRILIAITQVHGHLD